jgi:hypothetical protein
MKRARPPKDADEIEQLQWVGEQLGIPLPEWDCDDEDDIAAYSKAYSVWQAKVFNVLVARLVRGRGRPRRPSGRKPLSLSAGKKREQLARRKQRKYLRTHIEFLESSIVEFSQRPQSPDVESYLQGFRRSLAEAQARLEENLRASRLVDG